MRFGQYLVMDYEDGAYGFQLFNMKPLKLRKEVKLNIFNDDPDLKNKIKAIQYMLDGMRDIIELRK